MSNEWNDEEIEKLLQDLPKVSDTRSKDEVLAKLKQDERLQTVSQAASKRQHKKKSINWVQWGSLVAGFVLVLVIPLIVALNNKNPITKNDNTDQMEMTTAIDAEIENEMKKSEYQDQSSKTLESNIVSASNRMGDMRAGLYASELGEGDVTMMLGLANSDAEIVPVSFVVPASYIEENSLQGVSYLQLYEHIVSELNEEELGYRDFHPFEGTLEIEDGVLTNTLPDNHTYDQGTAATGMYFKAMSVTFSSVYDELTIKSEMNNNVIFSHVGEIKEPIDLKEYQQNKLYFLYESPTEQTSLLNSYSMTANSLQEAVSLLAENPSDYYKSPLIEGVTFHLEENKDYTTVQFDSLFSVEEYDEEQVMHMVEALIATAASFGISLKFENVSIQNWNGFDFSMPITDFISVNEIPFPLQ